MNYLYKISACFGTDDKIFAAHPLDEERAFDLLSQLRAEKVRWCEICKELERHLALHPQDHIDRQIERARKLFKPWLS